MIAQSKWFGVSLARRSTRRRIVVGYWLWLATFIVLYFRYQNRHTLDVVEALLVVFTIANISNILGGTSSAGVVKPFRGIHWAPLKDSGHPQSLFSEPGAAVQCLSDADADLDERETRVRDRVHFVAYTLSRWFALILFGLYVLLATTGSQWINRIGPCFLFLLTLTLWILPQSMILWNEPDMEAQ